MSYSRHVLSLYKRILRVGKTWEALQGGEAETAKEQAYIKNEAQRLFKLNKSVSDIGITLSLAVWKMG